MKLAFSFLKAVNGNGAKLCSKLIKVENIYCQTIHLFCIPTQNSIKLGTPYLCSYRQSKRNKFSNTNNNFGTPKHSYFLWYTKINVDCRLQSLPKVLKVLWSFKKVLLLLSFYFIYF